MDGCSVLVQRGARTVRSIAAEDPLSGNCDFIDEKKNNNTHLNEQQRTALPMTVKVTVFFLV